MASISPVVSGGIMLVTKRDMAGAPDAKPPMENSVPRQDQSNATLAIGRQTSLGAHHRQRLACRGGFAMEWDGFMATIDLLESVVGQA